MNRILPALVDLVIVGLFALQGRMAHHEVLTLWGWGATAWPFLMACLAGWLVLGLLSDSGLGVRAVAVIWLTTWLLGLGLRVSTGGSAQTSFILVAGALLLALFAGWRLVVYAVLRLQRRP